MQHSTKTIPELIGWVQQQGLGLQLSTPRLAYLLAIATVSGEGAEQELTEADLHDAFRYVSEMFSELDETLVTRANNAINEFVKQRLLNRFTADPVAGDSLYRLTPLALGIAGYYCRQREFSTVKLSIQLAQVATELQKAYQAARKGGDAGYWYHHVYSVLRYSVEDIFDRIDLTQRAMDEQQRFVKEEIAELLNHEWQRAINSCEQLLRETGTTLKELQDTLTAAGDQLQAILLNILEATEGRQELNHIVTISHQLQQRLDSIILWGQQCIELWGRYDRHVHKFIRTAIDMDRNRAFAQRLRESIGRFDSRSWRLTHADGKRLLDLRDEALVADNAEVTGELPGSIEFQQFDDVREQLGKEIRQYLSPYREQGEPIELADVITDFVNHVPLAEHFDLARMIIDEACRMGYAQAEHGHLQPQWKPINQAGAKVQAHVIDQYS